MTASVVALAGLFVVGIQSVGLQGVGAAAHISEDTGFSEPFSGTPQFEHVAPTEMTESAQLNRPIGQHLADEIAREIGLKKSDVLTEEQSREFIAGQGVPGSGDPQQSKLVDQSVEILTNTVGHPLPYRDENGQTGTSVLASYGVFVTTDGFLESPAYETAPTYLVNSVIMPGGCMSGWMKANGATKSLTQLYKSAYTSEAAYGNQAQIQSKPDELITNNKRGVSAVVGMSMGPALWVVNFALIYTLNPTLAADMPARWAPIPTAVVEAIHGAGGRVPYSQVASYFH
ncbi:MAG TPA: hypothetical protein VNU75_08625 [Acidimicrobiales bacterium]|nr:hypothetical protein [Acidimicrobiales bacterium]